MNMHELLAEREIYRALTRVARAMDMRDWSALDAIMLPDISGDLGTGPLIGRDEVVALMRSFLDDCGPTQHLLGNVLIDIRGDTAASQTYVSDMHVGVGNKSGETFSTLGDYQDRWKNVDGVWRMCHRVKLNRAHIGSYDVLGAGPSHWQPR